jgi:hypothetical protein
VNQESPTRLEPNNQILAATLHRSDTLTHELGRHLVRVVGAHESRVVDLDVLEPSPFEHGRDPRADGLDLGQLGHGSTLARGLAHAIRPLAQQADWCFTQRVAFLAGIVGALVGFTIGVVFTEIIFANNADWPIVVPFALAVSGWLGARELLRRRHDRKAEHGVPSASS